MNSRLRRKRLVMNKGLLQRRRTLLLVASVAVLLVLGNASASAAPSRLSQPAVPNIGIYPTAFSFDNALRGGQYTRTLGVVTSGTAPLTFTVSVRGTIAKWLGFFDPNAPSVARTQVTADPRGQLFLRLNVPRSAADGTYRGTIRVVSATTVGTNPASTSGSGSGVRVGADIAVGVHVTGTQIVKGRLDDSRALEKIEPTYPLRITNIVENDGNVVMKPNFDIAVEHGGRTVAKLHFDDRTVPAGGRSSIETDWQTSNSTDLGNYVAHVTASFDGVPFGARDVRFEVVPYGSLQRAGQFVSLVVANKVATHAAADVRATFRNTGQIEVKAVFVGVLERDGKPVRAITSVPELTLPGNEHTIDVFADVDSGGHYTVLGRINFEGRQTAERTVAFRVGAASHRLLLLLLLGSAAVVFVLAYAVLRARRRRAQRRPVRRTPRRGAPGAVDPIDLITIATGGTPARPKTPVASRRGTNGQL
jgi:hypothetical protein